MDNALEEAQQPGTLLQVAGGATVAIYAIYGLLGLIGLLWGLFSIAMQLLALLGTDDFMSTAIVLAISSWSLVTKLISSIMFAVLAFFAFKVFQAGAAMKELRDLELVQKAVMLAAGIPVVGLLGNFALSILGMDFCGILTWTMPQLLLLLLGGAAAYTTNQALQNENVVNSFSA